MKRPSKFKLFLLRAGIVVGGVSLVGLTFATVASAHNKVLSATCEGGLVVNLTQYNPSVVNTVKVIEDAATLADTTFGATYQHTFPNLAKTVAHSYHVIVTAGDGAQYGLDQTLPIPACQTPATTTTQPQETTTSTPTATTQAPAPTTVTPSTTEATPLPSSTTTTTSVGPTSSSETPAMIPPSTSPSQSGSPTTTTTSTSPSSGSTLSPTPVPTTSEGILIHVERDTNPPNLGPAPNRLPATGVDSAFAVLLACILILIGVALCRSSARSDRTVE